MLHLLLAVLWIFQPAQQPAAKPAPPVGVNDWEADEHRIGDRWLFVHAKNPQPIGFYEITFDVIVDPRGAIVSATARPPDPDLMLPARRVMSMVYRHGQRYGLIPRTQESNPMRFVRCKTTSSYEAMILTPEQAYAIVRNLREPERTLTLLAAGTGLRNFRVPGLTVARCKLC